MNLGRILILLGLAVGLAPGFLAAYPLDGYEETGIRRIEASRLANEGVIEKYRQPPGALLPGQDIKLGLLDSGLQLPPDPDAEFTASIREILGERADRCSLAVLDLTEPQRPRYAEHRGDEKQNVGSVGKLLVAQALFDALADAWGEDYDHRRRVLRESMVIADAFSVSDHHTIRIFDVENRQLTRRAMQIGDRGSLWEYLDWMLSVSSNSAASMVMRETMLLQELGQAYPVPDEQRQQFFVTTPAAALTRLFQKTFWEPISRSGLDLATLRQGSFFTRGGKLKVNGGGNSYATARSLLDWVVLMERGRLVDPWSSLEIKKLLYVTERRIRYASSPALIPAAVYSKSGSWWGCQEEPGFDCRPYHGNLRNYMNSVTLVEQETDSARLYYIVVLISNVLKENSAVTHQTMATRIHELIRTSHGLPAKAGIK